MIVSESTWTNGFNEC